MKVAIAGAGKLGFKVASALAGGDYSITIIDIKESVLDKISQQLDVMTVKADARKVSVLQDVGISGFDYLIASTGTDEINILVASFAKKLGCRHVLARVRDPEHMNQFDFIRDATGIDLIINPDMAITAEIYKYLAETYTLSHGIFTTDKASLIKFPAANLPKIGGHSIPEVRKLFPDFLVLALSRNGKVIIPHGDSMIEHDDLVYMLGEKKAIQEFSKKIHINKKNRGLKKVMIIGGGKTGFYLAKRLADFGAAVTVVETNLERCHYLATHLSNVLILHSDGTDLSLLEEENLDEMDAFITATGYDEENLLLALTAKHHGVPDVISKVSHENYKELTEDMGVDMVLNPLDISAGTILRYIQGSNRIISSVLIQGQAELLEIIVNSKMNLTHAPIKDLDLSDSILIASIHRGNQLIIPDGKTKIHLNDRVILLCLLSSIGDVEKLLKPRGLIRG